MSVVRHERFALSRITDHCGTKREAVVNDKLQINDRIVALASSDFGKRREGEHTRKEIARRHGDVCTETWAYVWLCF